MLRKICSVLIGTLLICGLFWNVLGDISSKGVKELWDDMREYVPESVLSEKHARIGAPDTATYLSMNSVFFAPKVAADGFVLLVIGAEIPAEGGTDTAYSGTIDLHAIEEFADGSATFYPITWPWFYPDTTAPIDTVVLREGMDMVWVSDTQPEEVIVYASARDGLKPTHPFVVTFDTAGAEPTKLLIEGQDKMTIGGFGMVRYIVKVVDDLNHTVADYGELGDTTKVTISVNEENPDNSAEIFDFMSGQTGQSIRVALISGMANVFLSDIEPETLTLIASSIDTLPVTPDTFIVDVLPEDESMYLMPISFSGTYGTKGIDKGILAMALAEEGADPTNNTSQVELKVHDIIGTASASIYPTGPQTLASGIASFKLSDTEADFGVIVRTITSGIPKLYPFWMVGDKITYGFKEPGKATMIRASGPSTAIVDDTITVHVYAVDAADSLDSTYDGWVWIDIDEEYYDGSCEVLEYGTGEPQDIIHIVNGIGRVWLVNSEPEEITAIFEDAERTEGPFGGYLGVPMPDYGIDVRFEVAGGTATQWALEIPSEVLFTGHITTMTIKAIDDTESVDVTFNDTATVSVTGFATLSDSLVPIIGGIGTVDIVDDSTEEVTITVSGAGLSTYEETLRFYAPGVTVFLVPIGPEEILVNDEAQISIHAMTADFMFDNTWNGVAKLNIIWDPGAPSVAMVEGNPDSIPIVNGVGNIKIKDFEVEMVGLMVDYVSGEPPLNPFETGEVEFEAKLVAIVPESASVGATPGTITFETHDANDNVVLYDTYIDDVWAEELGGMIPFSVTFSPPYSIPILNGIGTLQIYDIETETVEVYVWIDDPLIQERDIFIGELVFKPVGIESQKEALPKVFSLAQNRPNPISSITTIEYAVAKEGNVTLKVFDLAGRVIRTLVNAQKQPGYHTAYWDGRDDFGKKVTPGVYFYRIDAGNFTATKKLVLLK